MNYSGTLHTGRPVHDARNPLFRISAVSHSGRISYRQSHIVAVFTYRQNIRYVSVTHKGQNGRPVCETTVVPRIPASRYTKLEFLVLFTSRLNFQPS